MKKVLVIATLLGSFSCFADDAIQAKYQKSCIACHSSGAAGAPKTGDVEAWKPRLAKGMPALVASVEKGLNAMPPKGLCMDCTPAEVEALINYMAAPKK